MKKIIAFIVISVCLFSIVRSIQEIYQLSGKHVLVDRLSQKLTSLQQQHALLQQELARTNTSSFVEEEARNKLFLSKPSEVRVLVGTQRGDDGPVTFTKKPLSNIDQWRLVFNLL